MRCALAVLLAAACGRIGLDPRDDLADAAPPDMATSLACPAGTTELAPGDPACIEVAQRAAAPWIDAVATCGAAGRWLCAEAEWALACTSATGVVGMIGDAGGLHWEWVAETDGTTAHKRGWDSCDAASTHAIADPYPYRCCTAKGA